MSARPSWAAGKLQITNKFLHSVDQMVNTYSTDTDTDTDTCGCQIHLQFTVYSTLKLPLLAKKFTQRKREKEKKKVASSLPMKKSQQVCEISDKELR